MSIEQTCWEGEKHITEQLQLCYIKGRDNLIENSILCKNVIAYFLYVDFSLKELQLLCESCVFSAVDHGSKPCMLHFSLCFDAEKLQKRKKNTSTKFCLLEEKDFTPQLSFHGLHIIKIDGVTELEGTSRVVQFNSLKCSRSQDF